MEASQVFSLANGFVLPGWALLVFFPKLRAGRDLVAGVAMPLILGVLYLAILILNLGDSPEGGGFGSLEGVKILFSNEWGLLIGWIHFLAFDLFIGAWEVRDSQRVGIPHLVVVPCLLLTFMLGPVGLGIYLVLRGTWKKRWSSDELSSAALNGGAAS